MSLPNVFNSVSTVMREIQVSEMLQANTETEKFGLVLTAEDAKEIIEVRNEVLQGYGRIELDLEVPKKLILGFSASPFIHQEDYGPIIKELQEIFYYMKNETEDEIGDDELIEIIRDYFDNSCGGSIELMQGRELEEFARDVRRKRQISDYLFDEEV